MLESGFCECVGGGETGCFFGKEVERGVFLRVVVFLVVFVRVYVCSVCVACCVCVLTSTANSYMRT